MRILIVTQYFWPENFKINDLSLALKNLGHEITVLTGIPNYPAGKFYKGYSFFGNKKEYYNGIKVIRTIMFPRFGNKPFQLFLNYLSFALFASLKGLFSIKKKYDIIFVHEPSPITVGIPAIILKYKLKIPIFFWVLDLWPESIIATTNIKKGIVYKLVFKLTKRIYSKCDKILISSKGFSNSILEKGVPENKLLYFPNWAEDIFLQQQRQIKYRNIMPHGFNVMFAGNIGEAQDFETIVNAAELLKDNTNINWIIIGDGRKRNWLETEVKKRDLKNVYILGQYPLEEMPHFFALANAMLVTLKDEHIFSLTVPAKLQSYMASGKVIIGMLRGEGASIIAESKCGLCCHPGDYKSLADIIIKLSNLDKDKINIIEANAANYYSENFDRSILISRLTKEIKTYIK